MLRVVVIEAVRARGGAVCVDAYLFAATYTWVSIVVIAAVVTCNARQLLAHHVVYRGKHEWHGYPLPSVM